MKYRRLLLAAWTLAWAPVAAAQSTANIPEGAQFPTQNNARVNGVRIRVASDGAVWFLESSADIVARLKDGVMRQWQLRPTDQIGANPVDFQFDGDDESIIWLIESGQSQIPSGTCAYAKLDTTTGALTEWVVPGTIPATFYRAPDGTVWLPQSGAVLQSLNLSTLQVVNYRSTLTYAYADMIVAPDGAFWLADFGDNRIVRWMPGAATETSWAFYPLSSGRLFPSQIAFDDQGYLWISQRGSLQFPVNLLDRFDPATGVLRSYGGFTNPIHFDIFQNRFYATSVADPSAVFVFDPALAVPVALQTLTAQTLDVGSSPSLRAVTIRNTLIVPTDFVSAPAAIAAGDFAVTALSTGLVKVTFPAVNTWAVTVAGGHLWTGTDSTLAALNLQTIGNATDQAVPVATSLAGPSDSRIQIDMTVANLGGASISGQAFYLFSAGAFATRTTFTLAAGATSLLSDAFGNLAGTATLLNGPVRLGVTSGTATDLDATVRSSRVLPSGGTFGYLLPAAGTAASLRSGSTTTLFTGASASEASILALYVLEDANATLTLAAPDGTTRGSRAFDLAKNASLLFNPASSAFGVPSEPGDVVRTSVASGSLQASVLVFDTGTTDIAPSLPATPFSQAIFPYAGSLPGDTRSLVSDLFLSNPAADVSAEISISYAGIGSASPQTASVTLAPLQSQTIANVLPTLFGVPSGAGALVVSSSLPVASSLRIASSESAGDYGTYANSIDGAGGIAGGQSATAIGLPQTATRTSYLLLYNSGAAGSVTVTGYRADGAAAGQFDVALGSQAAGLVASPFAALGISNQPAGRIRVDVPAGMQVFAWTAAQDTITGDIDISPLQY